MLSFLGQAMSALNTQNQGRSQQAQGGHLGNPVEDLKRKLGRNGKKYSGKPSEIEALSKEPILADMGKAQLLAAAEEDSSSWRCPACKGLIAAKRKEQHKKYFCE